MAGGLDLTRPFIAVGVAILTVSDTRGESDDRSGEYLASAVVDSGHRLVERLIVRDEVVLIGGALDRWIGLDSVDVVVATGGTGLTARDVTVEAFRMRFEKEIDGFAAIFHRLSYDVIGVSTIQSRACGGVCGGTYLFSLPGSPGACRDAWEKILCYQLDNRFRPCNLVEILPRLREV